MNDKKINLCDTCKFCFADCANGEEGKDFFFGTGLGYDNVCKCKAYKSKNEGGNINEINSRVSTGNDQRRIP